jgi:hypothetical protein
MVADAFGVEWKSSLDVIIRAVTIVLVISVDPHHLSNECFSNVYFCVIVVLYISHILFNHGIFNRCSIKDFIGF